MTSILYYLVLQGSLLLNSDIVLIFNNYQSEKLVHRLMTKRTLQTRNYDIHFAENIKASSSSSTNLVK